VNSTSGGLAGGASLATQLVPLISGMLTAVST